MAPPRKSWTIERFYSMTEQSGECLIWKGKVDKTGYGGCWNNGGNIGSHRMAWILNYGPIPAGLCVMHTCDVRACVRKEHLMIGTYQENSDDMMRKGRQWHVGSKHKLSKTNEHEVARIRSDWNTGKFTKMDLVRKYKLSHPTIRRIISKSIWKHVA